MIDIDHEDCQRVLFASGQSPLRFAVFVEVSSIAQAGESVNVGQAQQFAVDFHELALTVAQLKIGRIALLLIKIPLGVMPDAGDQLRRIGEFDRRNIR